MYLDNIMETQSISIRSTPVMGIYLLIGLIFFGSILIILSLSASNILGAIIVIIIFIGIPGLIVIHLITPREITVNNYGIVYTKGKNEKLNRSWGEVKEIRTVTDDLNPEVSVSYAMIMIFFNDKSKFVIKQNIWDVDSMKAIFYVMLNQQPKYNFHIEDRLHWGPN
jgi:hypothetical protein